MADDEQFSLCWNNFNSNLSAGFHESLQRGDLVDVTLAAEGHLVKAHRLILSVCSPYFRKMFTQVPVNQHAFIFLKDVSHSALQDLIQFMYCGEVNVKQDALPAFISTAEALQIKGLTETGDSAPTHQSPAKEEPAAAAAVPVTTATISTATIPASPASQRAKVQRNRIQSYKLESEESGDDKVVHIQATTSHHVSAQSNLSSQKRTMPQRGLQSHASKRTKMSISASSDGLDTSDSTPAQVQTVQTVQIVKQIPAQVIEPEYIELPIESINPKAEPDYTDETAEIETVDAETEQEQKLSEHDQGDADDDGNYVEDDTYGDMAMGKYEESYLTEGEEGAKPGVSGFVDSYTSDGGNATEISTQGCVMSVVDANWYPLRMGGDSTHGSFRAPKFTYKQSQRSGRQLLVVNGIHFFRNRERNGKQYWKCNQYYKCKCPCIVLINTATSQLSIKHNHNHETTTGTAEEESVMQGRSRTGHQTGSSSVRSFPGRLLNGGGGNKTTNRRATTIPSDGRRVDRYESLSIEALGSASSSSHEGNAADGHC
ncbi:AGAP003439-PE [Anopheles gambiae str. PEST]|uniref:AGAP003439-PE n=1 Tax=Anopheles gambiae TaxID=7165 RepID=Q6IDY5_ANOGA|nr:AGAP003439-PE [Anopheles gambiae str. PEST]CAE54328.1 TPA: Mod(mdg4)-h59.3 [Anopheles gambiae]